MMRSSLRQGQHAFEALAPMSAAALLPVRVGARSFHLTAAARLSSPKSTAADRIES